MPYPNTFLSGAHSALPRPIPPPILTQDPTLKEIHDQSGYGPTFEGPQTAFEVSPARQHGLPFAGPRSAPPLLNHTPYGHQGFASAISPQGTPFPPQQLSQGDALVNGQHFPPQHIHTPPHTDPNVPSAQQYHSSPNFAQQWQQPNSNFPPTPVSISPEYKPILADAALPTPTPTLTSQSSDSVPFIKHEDTKPQFWDSNINGQPLPQSQQDALSRMSDRKPSLHQQPPRKPPMNN